MNRVRVLNVALHNPRDGENPDARTRVDHGLDNITKLLERGAGHDPDIVLFPEVALQHAARQDGLLEAAAQPIPGPATNAVGETAKQIDSYVVLPMYERSNGQFHNSAALIDPDGEVVGTFRKLAPTVGEMDAGIVPGTDIPVWDTELGRIGMMICWDCRYPRAAMTLGAKGVDLVCLPTHGSAHQRLRTWALYQGFHIACCDKSAARIYTPRRNTVGDANHGWNSPLMSEIDLHGGTACFAFAEINTDINSYTRANSKQWATALHEEEAGSVQIDQFNDDGINVVESIDPERPLGELEAEYDMESVRGYEERTRDRIRSITPSSPLLDERVPDSHPSAERAHSEDD